MICHLGRAIYRFSVCMRKAISRWPECTQWGTNQLCNAIARFYPCCATQLHGFLPVVQRNCAVLLLLCNAIARFMDGFIHAYTCFTWLISQPAYGWVHPCVWPDVFLCLPCNIFYFQFPHKIICVMRGVNWGCLGFLVYDYHTLNVKGESWRDWWGFRRLEPVGLLTMVTGPNDQTTIELNGQIKKPPGALASELTEKVEPSAGPG